MEWYNLKTSALHATEFIGSEPRARATWLNVSLWCAQQENGGRIAGARGWKCRQWQQTCGVTLKEVVMSERLLTWDGDDLLVWNYPASKEDEVRTKREAGRIGGRARTPAKLQAARSNGFTTDRQPHEAEHEAQHQAAHEADTKHTHEGKGKERNRKGKEGIAAPVGAHTVGQEKEASTAKPEAPAADNPAPQPPPAEPAIAIPPVLDIPRFTEPFNRWVAIRRRFRAPKTPWPEFFALQLAWLASLGLEGAIASVEQSARNQWQGLFEPRRNFNSTSHAAHQRPNDRAYSQRDDYSKASD